MKNYNTESTKYLDKFNKIVYYHLQILISDRNIENLVFNYNSLQTVYLFKNIFIILVNKYKYEENFYDLINEMNHEILFFKKMWDSKPIESKINNIKLNVANSIYNLINS